jgi:type II secretory pathway pseudopilin PulG
MPISMKTNHSQGFSLVEMLVYVSVLTIILLFVVSTLMSFTTSYRTLAALRATDHAAVDAMERMTRTIRGATAITALESSFATNSGVLTLVSTSGNNSTTTKFYLDSGTLKQNVNGVYYGPLTASNAEVTNLTFYLLSTTTTSAIRIDMTIEGQSGTVTKTKQFHATIVAKGT